MEFPFEETRLWRTTLAEQPDDRFTTSRGRLRAAFLNLRERAAILAAEISVDLRDLTVHDLSHSDALWETADLVTGNEIELNPLEAFVLGASFLIHDLGMGLSAYPEGLDSLKLHRLWPGMLRNFIKRFSGASPTPEQLLNPPAEPLLRTQFELLRILHAQQADKLATISWSDGNGDQFHLLEDKDLRSSLGHLIGQISHSHWWPIDEVANVFDRDQGPPTCLPGEWRIDKLRLALMLRLADAAHIDARRAPAFLRVLRKPEAASDLHWKFQEKLNKVQLEHDRLMYTGSPFNADDAGAWWLCVDTLRMIDGELRQADNLLSDRRAQRFQARGVFGVDDLPVLAKLIKPEGWVPVDAHVHVSSLTTLVSKLGGEQLYGRNDLVPLRELLQNSADAIHARRVVKNNPAWGLITMRTGVDIHGSWIEIEDDGIGMSPQILVGALLDFGNSFWSSQDSVHEFPDLAATDFRSIGRFGIGFFSVFMWGDRVSVTSRKLDSSSSDTHVLTFHSGVGARPILRAAEPNELLPEGGTRVRVWLRNAQEPNTQWMQLQYPISRYFAGDVSDPRQLLSFLSPLMDIDIRFASESPPTRISAATDWRKQTPLKLVKDSYSASRHKKHELMATHIKTMRNGAEIVGRAALVPEGIEAWLLMGGLKTSSVDNFAGVFKGEPRKASREDAFVNVPAQEVARWATEQARLMSRDYSKVGQAACSRHVAQLGGTTTELAIGKVNNVWSNSKRIERWARNQSQIIVLRSYEEYQIKANLGLSKLKPNVVIEPDPVNLFRYFPSAERVTIPETQAQLDILRKFRRAGYIVSENDQKSHRPVLAAIAQAWSRNVEDLFIINSYRFNVAQTGRYLVSDADIIFRVIPTLPRRHR